MAKLRPEERFPIIYGHPLPEPKKIGRPFDARLAEIDRKAVVGIREGKYEDEHDAAKNLFDEYIKYAVDNDQRLYKRRDLENRFKKALSKV